MTTNLRTGTARFGAAAAMLLLAGAAQALTFISPMGEPFRSRPGETPPEEQWFQRADVNNDGKITLAEFTADAGRFFRALDTNHDNLIGPEEIQHYEDDIAPETLGGIGDVGPGAGGGHGGGGGGHGGHGGGSRRHGGGGGHSSSDEGESGSSDDKPAEHYDAAAMGAARFSYLDLPEPVAAADFNIDRAISPREFVEAARQRFDALDANHDGLLTREELPHLGGAHGGGWQGKSGGGHRPHGEGPPPGGPGGQ